MDNNKVNGLKNLIDVPMAEDASNLNLIVNDDGEIKQIAASAVGAQADWNTTDEASPSYIVNKPAIPAAQIQADWTETDKTSAAFIINKPVIAPLVLNSSQDYSSDSEMGDLALNSILAGRQILVRVPNADGGNFTAIYSPILMYQLPNYANQYLYLFFLLDEKQDLSSLVPGLTVPTYGQIKMKLSQVYNSCPLESN